ncbi:HAD-IIB family hydrolase [Methylomarinum sp. Ch1-1]|uniref:HAD-IIB family hydrolase n=1 Tax=Methylomarinum roseum TaxID=3067653 RepID=A0AAU7NYP8_9GAMM|nr:HAD-IIB family hydrolase [Methylomarinum sp. Ch1-1]MDP4521810.1 HAD-IIB family hydrolase [Methylomarinum sp. Ch1-1]
MSERRLLLCTDMDRTVIPNGVQSEHPNARKRFAAFCRQPGVKLVYVTGRHQALVKQAIKNYALPDPDFVITDVGSKIYRVIDDQWRELSAWEMEIDKDWHGKSHQQIKQLLGDISNLHLQEPSKQNTHKLSYYLPLHVDKDGVIAAIKDRLEKENIDASLVWSIDEPKGIGLLDVLPRNATKLHAIEFLQQQLGYHPTDVVFAGDSGNDLPVLGSAIRSVLVANATDEIKQAAQQLARRNGHGDALYIAAARGLHMNGNYAAGVLEGVWHFAPDFRDKLQQDEVDDDG